MNLLHDEVRRLLHKGVTPDKAARRAVEWADKGLLSQYVLPMVTAQAQRWARQMARAAEDRAFRAPSVIRQVGQVLFSLGDGSSVTWRDASALQHRARALWQETMAGECLEDAMRHRRAADLVEQHGAASLGDLPPELWADLVENASASGEVPDETPDSARTDVSSDDAPTEEAAAPSERPDRRTARKRSAKTLVGSTI